MKKTAFSLMELLVAVSLFIVIMLLAGTAFTDVLKNQRYNVQEQAAQENLRHFWEVFTREASGAQFNESFTTKVCNVLPREMFAVGTNYIANDTLYFKNANGDCVAYYAAPDVDNNNVNRLAVMRGENLAYITLPSFKIVNLQFFLTPYDTENAILPFVSARVGVQSPNNAGISDLNLEFSFTPDIY